MRNFTRKAFKKFDQKHPREVAARTVIGRVEQNEVRGDVVWASAYIVPHAKAVIDSSTEGGTSYAERVKASSGKAIQIR